MAQSPNSSNADAPDVTRDDGTYALGPVPETPPTGSGSLLGLAEHAVPNPSDTPDAETSKPSGPAPIERCARCGYDLTGLALTTACPECGSNERRLDTAQRPVADAGWLTTLSRSITIAWAAIGLASVTSLAQLVFGRGQPTPWLGGLSIDDSLMGIAKLMGAVALLIITQPNPAFLGTGTHPDDESSPSAKDRAPHSRLWPAPPRLIARYGALAFGVLQLLTIAASIALPAALKHLVPATVVVAVPTLFAGITHAAAILEQLGHSQQAFEARILRFGWVPAILGTAGWYAAAARSSTGDTLTPVVVILVLLIVVLLFWSFALLIHLGQSIRQPLQNAD